MIRSNPLRLLPSLVALCWLASPALAQDPEAFVVTQVFGGAEGEPGFRVRFDRRGASVRSIDLLDHDAPRVRGDEEPTPYRIVQEEQDLDPRRTQEGWVTWLSLSEVVPSPQFGDIGSGLDASAWEVVEQVDGRSIRFVLDNGRGTRIEKLFAYDGDGRRDLRIEIAVTTAAGAEVQRPGGRFRLALRGLALASPKSDYVLNQNPAMAVGMARDPQGEQVLSDARADGPTNVPPALVPRVPGVAVDYAGSTNRFFGVFLYPIDDGGARSLVGAEMLAFPWYAEQNDTPPYSVPVCKYLLELPVPEAGGESRAVFRLFLGPKSFRVFAEHAEYEQFDPVLEKALDPMCFCSIPGSRTMAVFLLWLLGILHDVVGNWGVAIMCLTVLVRGSLVPLNFRMQKSMRVYGQKMAKLKPKLDALQKKYANEPKVLQAKMVEFQREHKLIPPLGGCLPLLVTIPVFLGLFTALRISYDLRQQPFFGWVDDLSRPDQLFELGLGPLAWFNLLPIVMVGMWLWLQSGTPLPTDPQQRQVMKIMRFMPLVFGVMLYNYASGLMVYMITSSAFGLIEQRVTRKLLGPVDPNAAGIGATPMI